MRSFRHILARLGATETRAAAALHVARLVQPGLRLSFVLALLLIAFFYFFPLYGGIPPILLPPLSLPLPDPLPLRRVLVNPEQMPGEIERARQGILQEIPRAEFEGLVQRAALAAEALKSPPRLIEARYRATLNEANLVGTAQCTILHTVAAPGILTLQPFSLALRKAMLDGREAILADLDGKSTGLLIEHLGKHTLALDWSARSEPGPNGLHFELKVPPCALTSFDLDLPEGRTPALARDGCLLSGPLPGSAPGRKQWRLECAGAAQVDLVIQNASGPGEPRPLLLAHSQTKQSLFLDRVESSFDFTLEVLHGAVREINLICPPQLTPLTVSMRSSTIETWEVRPGAQPGESSILHVRLPEPVQGASLPFHVHGLSPVLPGSLWTCPGLQIAGAINLGETLSLQLAPDVQLGNWHAGDFVLVKAMGDAEGGQTLTFQSGTRQPNVARDPARPLLDRPSAQIGLQDVDFRVRQLAWWQIRPEGASLAAHLGYEVLRGRMYRLVVRLPANWNADRVEITPADLLGNWMVARDNGQDRLIVDLQRPLEAPAQAVLKLGLRPVQGNGTAAPYASDENGEVSFAFPQLVPEGTSQWSGGLAISVDELYQPVVSASLPSTSLSNRTLDQGSDGVARKDEEFSPDRQPQLAPNLPAPWGNGTPSYYYTFRNQPVTGVVKLRPRAPRVQARCSGEVVIASGRAAILMRLHVRPEVGKPTSLDFFVSTPVSGPWKWQVKDSRNSVRGLQRLHFAEVAPQLSGLAATDPLSAAALLSMPSSRGSLWRLTFAEPLAEPVTLETTLDIARVEPAAIAAALPGPLAGATPLGAAVWSALAQQIATRAMPAEKWAIPLLTVLAADRMEGEVKVHLAGADLVEVEALGLRESVPGPRSGSTAVWRSFHYGRPPFSLVLHGRIVAADQTSAPEIDSAHLTTFVQPGGLLLSHLALQLHRWEQRTLPIRLPPGTEYRAARLDGHWLPRPASIQPADSGLVIELPIAIQTAVHEVEVIYDRKMPSWRLWTQLDAPVPILPLEAATFRHTWCLPPGIVPLRQASAQLLPVPGTKSETGSIQEFMRISKSYVAPLSGVRIDEWRPRQLRLLMEANAYLRNQRRDRQSLCLGDVLTALVFQVFKDQEPLVIDQVALQAAGVGALTPLNDPEIPGEEGLASGDEGALAPFDRLGLVCVPTPYALLVTTRRQWQTQPSSEEGTGYRPERVQAALGEAIAQGHDSSGRFVSALDWLSAKRTVIGKAWESDSGGSKGASGDHDFLVAREGWTEWQRAAGPESDEPLTVIRQDALSGAALALSGLILLAGWRARACTLQIRYRLLLLCLAAGGLVLLWLPSVLSQLVWWPVLTAAVVAGVWCLMSALRPAKATEPKAVAAAMLVLILTVAIPGRAADQPPLTVWLLPNKSVEKQSALVAPDLLQQLRAMSRQGAGGLQGAMLLRARYEGTCQGGTADFLAEFQVHSFDDSPADLAIPLSGIELRDALLDDNPAYPMSLPPPLNGYTIKVKGRGSHRLRLHFAVPKLGAGQEEELRFAIPELLQSQLSLTVLAGASYLHAPTARGAQGITSDLPGTHLNADLGRIAALHVRWFQAHEHATPATVNLKELYLWDLRASTSRLLSILQYSVSAGGVSIFKLDVPENMEVRRVESGPLPASGPVPPLKQWQLTRAGNQRQLQLEYQFPVTHGVQVFLELVPSGPREPDISLSLPTPEGTPAASSLDSYVGYRVEGCQAELLEYRRVTGIDPETFSARWQLAGTEDPGPPEKAYAFRRGPAGAPLLRLALTAPRSHIQGVQDILWQVGLRSAQLQNAVHLKGIEDSLLWVEWDVPAEVAIADVVGKDVRNWSRTGSRVQVWLQRAVSETSLMMIGSLPRSPEESTAPFHIPCITLRGAEPATTYVRLISRKGQMFQAENIQNLWPLPEARLSGVEQTYVTRQGSYGGILQVHPAPTNVALRMLTSAEVLERRLSFTCILDFPAGLSDLRHLTLHLRNWQGQEVKLTAPKLARREQRRDDAGDYTWSLDLAPEVTSAFQIKLSGSVPLTSAEDSIPMPVLSVEEIPAPEHWLALVGRQLSADELRGLEIADPVQAARLWPAVADRMTRLGSSVWRVEREDWKLRLQTRSPGVESEPVRVFLTEHAAGMSDSRHWLHRGTYWIYHAAGTDLSVSLPRGAVFSRATLDGVELLPLQPSGGRLWLPLTASTGMRSLCLYWHFPDETEPFARPNLADPELAGVSFTGPSEMIRPAWIIQVPSGYRVVQHDRNVQPEVAVNGSLRRAAAQLYLSGFLADRASEGADRILEQQLLNAQENFYRYTSQAQLALTRKGAPAAAGGTDIAARLEELLSQNKQLAQGHHFEQIRTLAESQATVFFRSPEAISRDRANRSQGTDFFCQEWAEQGTPSYWEAGASDGMPQIQLIALEVQQTQRAFGLTGLILVLFLIAWTLPHFPRLVAWMRTLWPEELISFVLLGMLVYHPNLGFWLIVLFGILARLIYTTAWGLAILHRRMPVTASPGSSFTSSS
ncbi:MAG TPA: hypothetical protein VK395_19985 [Gemmataceae bacterium]|nr:hypothetical protein [Gemmataceae bacterium]